MTRDDNVVKIPYIIIVLSKTSSRKVSLLNKQFRDNATILYVTCVPCPDTITINIVVIYVCIYYISIYGLSERPNELCLEFVKYLCHSDKNWLFPLRCTYFLLFFIRHTQSAQFSAINIFDLSTYRHE